MIYDIKSNIYMHFLRGGANKKIELGSSKLKNSDFSKDGFGDDGRGG